MKRLVPYIAIVCLTTFTATSGLPVMAGGCNRHRDKISEKKCAKDDTDCQIQKLPNSDLKINNRS